MTTDRVQDGRHLMNLGARYATLAAIGMALREVEAMQPRAPWVAHEGRVERVAAMNRHYDALFQRRTGEPPA